MLVNGYEIGEEPTREEFATYRKVQAFFQRETAAQYLEGKRPLCQQEFEMFVEEFADLEADQGEEERDNLDTALEYVTERIVYFDPWDE